MAEEPTVVEERGTSISGPPWADRSPRIVALDIDGTLLRWGQGVGTSHETVTARVHDAVQRALDAGAHVVLSSGRSPHGMVRMVDRLGLVRRESEPLWVVASNGAVVFRYPPMEVVHEDTFDAREAVLAVLAEHPEAMVAVEERGVGYRINRPFPEGELSGEMVLGDLEDMLAHPVSRVVIRDPDATADDFLALAGRLGLHGTEYVVGWTGWLDLAPVGVSKASGLAVVARELGVDRSEVLAIGDGRNDTDMLRWAGRGVAMGQAIEDVREAADDVTGTADDDGVALELEQWFPARTSTGRERQR